MSLGSTFIDIGLAFVQEIGPHNRNYGCNHSEELEILRGNCGNIRCINANKNCVDACENDHYELINEIRNSEWLW